MPAHRRTVVRLLQAVGLLVAGLLLAVVLLWIAQRRLVYFPTQSVPDAGSVLPGATAVTYQTEDGLTLDAWWVPAAGATSEGTVVLFNGNGGNRVDRAPLAAALGDAGYAVLMVDYRGYGGNPGRPSEEGLTLDARAAVDHVLARPDVDTDRLAYFGESLGAAVALAAAEHREPAALVLRSPFTSLPEAAAVHYPYLPTSQLLWDRYPNKQSIRGIDVPVLVVAGSADRIVPVDQSRAVYEAAPGPKELVVVDGAGHNDLALTSGPQLVREVVDFLDDVLPGTDGRPIGET